MWVGVGVGVVGCGWGVGVGVGVEDVKKTGYHPLWVQDSKVEGSWGR